MLGNLDNEVIFKKAFTNKFVLQCFVKDIFGLDFEPDKIETEKRFKPKIAHIDLKYDIFAESKEQRIILEIQKVDYDYNFDRFLLYHNMAIAEQQRTSKEYKAEKLVLTVVFFTSKYYKITERNGQPIEKDILIFNNNLFSLEGQEIDVFGHKLIFLNHHYIKNNTPQGYKDWLELIQESIKNPSEPNINLNNQGVKKVSELINYENLSPEELTESKNRHAAESIKAYWEEELRKKEVQAAQQANFNSKIEVAQNALKKGFDNHTISELTGLSLTQIEELRTQTPQ